MSNPHNICWNQAADRLEEEVEYLLENVMQPLNEVSTLRKLIKEFRNNGKPAEEK